MNVLFINICSKGACLGHKQFDAEWCMHLSLFGKVDLVQPESNWYNHFPLNVNLITFDSTNNLKKLDYFLIKALNIFRVCGFDPNKYSNDLSIIRYLKKMNRKNHYDVIVAAHFDIVPFALSSIRKNLLKKVFVIEHLVPVIKNPILSLLYNKKKNLVNHIAMEKAVVNHLLRDIGVKENRVFYIPHPFNKPITNFANVDYYDVVGISNSNSLEYIKAIVDYEEANHFFASRKIKVLLRNKVIQYDNGYLKVVKGWIHYSIEQYYSLIAKAKVILVPFPISFGARTSGTIIDALSYRICSIGSPFETFISYCDDYPNACMTFNNMDDLMSKIDNVVNNKNPLCDVDFDNFYKERSGTNMLKYFRSAFINL